MAFPLEKNESIIDTYTYQPLDSKKHQIRLLELCAMSASAAHYRLATFDYEIAPSYVALSYTWGDPDHNVFVIIDGKKFEIQQGLARFLRTYRERTYLWIDQMCINQSDFQERNHQVSLMAKIYMRCDFVLVWLQDESYFTRSTYQAALDFNKGIQRYDESSINREERGDNTELINRPVLALMLNRYFSRLWIVQELLLARNVRILVEGNIWVSWKSLFDACHTWSSELRMSVPGATWLVTTHLHKFVLDSITPKNASYYFTHAVHNCCKNGCRDTLDKVYGLMSLIKPENRIRINYEAQPEALYLQACTTMVREYGDMTYDRPNSVCGYELFRFNWNMETSREASIRLAKEMFKDPQKLAGLESFIEAVWNRVQTFETTKRCLKQKVDFVHRCIPSMGFQTGTDTSKDDLCEGDRQKCITYDRWWYRFEDQRYYHDCKEKSIGSDQTSTEYTE
jgi:hypothetical protein